MTKEKRFIMFSSPSCGACVRVKKELEQKFLQDKVTFFDVTTPEGLAEAAFWDALETPFFILNNEPVSFKDWWEALEEDKNAR